jgi:two-component system sensor histidine kinase BaeS
MRSLTVKLTLAFLLIGLIGAVMVAFLVRQSTQRQFDRFVFDQNQQTLVTNLAQYYQANGSWEGVETVFRPGQEVAPAQNSGRPAGPGRNPFILADSNGRVVFGGDPRNPEQKLTSSELKKGIPIEVNGSTVGWLVFAPALDQWRPGTPEGDFLLSVNRAIYLSALAATLIALILGGILAYTLTRSLREMTAATKLLAKGELGHQVKVRSRDELGILAASFNQMSSELERSNELRRKMTADIAHDLRTPLSVIMGYTEALSDSKLEPTPEIFQVMHTETVHLNHLVDDLKTLSLAESGELPLVRQPISPEELLNRAASAYRVQAEKKNIVLKMDVAPGLPHIEVDVERMAQVLNNLMSNALRYTPDGGQITLTAEAANGGVQLLVADNGSGIMPDDLPFIFERSFRGDKARRLLNGETGLGLAIAKSLVEAQGGKIAVESQPGKGTRFAINFSV